MIFFELKTYGDFDIPITDSMWYKENPTDKELTFLKHGILLNELLIEFRKLSGEKFKMSNSPTMYCNRNQSKILQAFKDYLGSRGYRGVLADMQLQFTDENLDDMISSQEEWETEVK